MDDNKIQNAPSTVAKLPGRSPLHEEALVAGDLVLGLNIQLHSTRHDLCLKAMVNGRPFRCGEKYDREGMGHKWMVSVVTTDFRGRFVRVEWFLADMGVVPVTNCFGEEIRWNDTKYTLRV